MVFWWVFVALWTWVLDLGDICQHLVPSDFWAREVYLILVITWCIRGFGSGSPRIVSFADRTK